MKIFYHGDADGRCAAAIVKFANPKSGLTRSDFVYCTFEKPMDINRVGSDEEVWIVDFHPDDITTIDRLLERTTNIKWFDHHISVQEKYTGSKYESIKGTRSTDGCGAILVWKYLFGNKPIPEVVDLTDDFDRWIFKNGIKTTYFNNGLYMSNNHPDEELWNRLLIDDNHSKDLVREIINTGMILTRYQEKKDKYTCGKCSFPVTFYGYRGLACNVLKSTSKFWGDRIKNFDICIAYVFDGTGYVTRLYTEKDIDLTKILMEYGGGGHPKCGGAYLKNIVLINKPDGTIEMVWEKSELKDSRYNSFKDLEKVR